MILKISQEFLKNFGYIDSSSSGASSITPEKVTEAILEYQDFYGLNQTGKCSVAQLLHEDLWKHQMDCC